MLLDGGMMGDGVIDILRIRTWMEQSGYAGPVEGEIFSQDNGWKRAPGETLAVCAKRLESVC